LALKRIHPELDEKTLFMLSNKIRYDKPVSEPPSPSASRSSTPHHFSEADDSESDSDEDEELKRINSTGNSEKSFNQFIERAKSTENVFKNLDIKTD
jgi:hypothetical protein